MPLLLCGCRTLRLQLEGRYGVAAAASAGTSLRQPPAPRDLNLTGAAAAAECLRRYVRDVTDRQTIRRLVAFSHLNARCYPLKHNVKSLTLVDAAVASAFMLPKGMLGAGAAKAGLSQGSTVVPGQSVLSVMGAALDAALRAARPSGIGAVNLADSDTDSGAMGAPWQYSERELPRVEHTKSGHSQDI
jgi:hypothetical protein